MTDIDKTNSNSEPKTSESENKTKNALLELISEPMPASMQEKIWRDLFNGLQNNLRDDWGYELEDVPEEYQYLVTPYRVVIILKDLPTFTHSRVVEHRGPRENAPDKAVDGFLSRWGVTRDDCTIEATNRGSFWFYHEKIEGKSMREALSKAFIDAITQLKWDKVMRFADEKAIWIRPLQRMVGVFGDEKLVGGLDCKSGTWAESGNIEEGFLEYQDSSWDDMLCLGKGDTPEEIPVRDINDYEDIDIVLKPTGRYKDLEQKYFGGGGDPYTLFWLSGIIYLVERGELLPCEVEYDTGELPEEVIKTALLDHLKVRVYKIDAGKVYFCAMIEKRRDNSQDMSIIKKGYESVAKARLEDSKFFWNEDCKLTLEDRIPMLDRQVWHGKLGSVGDKARRLEKLCPKIAKLLGASDGQIGLAKQAGRISKSDLASHMVIEYPSLQGIIGSYYAEREKLDFRVCDALKTLYGTAKSPAKSVGLVGVLGSVDGIDTIVIPDRVDDLVGIALGLADSIDTIVGMWSVGEKPTGSRDPFALDRAADGVILSMNNYMQRKDKNISIKQIIELSREVWGGINIDSSDLLEYFRERSSGRIGGMFAGGTSKSLSLSHYVLRQAAVYRHGDDDLYVARTQNIYKALVELDVGGKLRKLSEMARRVYGLAGRREERLEDYDELLATELAEKELMQGVNELPVIEDWSTNNVRESMLRALQLSSKVDIFCDRVRVNEEGKMGENRKALLGRLANYLDNLANFEILIKGYSQLSKG